MFPLNYSTLSGKLYFFLFSPFSSGRLVCEEPEIKPYAPSALGEALKEASAHRSQYEFLTFFLL